MQNSMADNVKTLDEGTFTLSRRLRRKRHGNILASGFRERSAAIVAKVRLEEATMMKWTMRLACGALALALAPVAQADNAANAKPAAKMEATYLSPTDLKWGAAPPELPKGAQIAVLHGDPSKPGTFAFRFKMPDGYQIAPHWHSKDEQLTVVEGQLVLHFGDSLKAEAHTLTTGSYHFLPAKMHHAAEAKGETVVQINGEGPFDIHYLNPADNPNPKAAQLDERPTPARR